MKKTHSLFDKEKNIFVVQKHFARHLHYDFRLEIGGVLKSFAIPKGPPKIAKEKRLAILTEDHELSYASFEGEIPKGEYGAGKVEIWDRGYYKNVRKDKRGKSVPMKKCLDEGVVEIELFGKKLKGKYTLIHMKENNYLLIKK